MDALKLPEKGFTKAERAWLAKLIEAINTTRAIAGRNVTISEQKEGTTINANDCEACPPCP